MKKLNINHLYLFVWVILLCYGSISSPNNLPRIRLFEHADKVIHLIMYFVLSFLLVPSLLKQRGSTINLFLAFAISVTTGTLMEYLQMTLTTTREASAYDLIFNILGAFLGIITYRFCIFRSKIEKLIFKS